MPIKKSSNSRLERVERRGPRLEWDLSVLSDDELQLLEQYLASKLPESSAGDEVTSDRAEHAERICSKIPRRWVWGR